ncbi:MAG: pantoate--beta-alanine ligase [Chloroflexi bacterium]|nr:pantoate--beta-alanine ligase [Chloroflexota bacterium]
MQIARSVGEMRDARRQVQGSIGFVPTMGYLHAGHRSLIERAREECRTVVVSIFVNPLQFGPEEDYGRYPRDVPRDLALCEQAGVDVVFVPEVQDIYPMGAGTVLEVRGLQDRWEGASRLGHFQGVATVVAKLLSVVQPTRAYFGEKDYQQLQIVRRLAADLLLDLEIVGCPTIREPDGLAVSSRNVYLSAEARGRAMVLFRALTAAQDEVDAGEHSAAAVRATMRKTIESVQGVDLDYAEVVDPTTLEPLDTIDREARAIVAAGVDDVRLIDNTRLTPVGA